MKIFDRMEAGRDGARNLVAAWLIMFTIIGIPAIMIPVLYGPIVDDTGWTRGQVSLLTSMKFFAGAAATFFSGLAVERLGARAVTIFCLFLTGTALISMLVVDNLAVFYAFGGLLGVGALGAVTAMKIFLSRWFNANQGLAIGIALTGISAAGVIVPIVVTELNQLFGWRMTAAVMSAPLWLVALPVFFGVTKEKPPAAIEAKKSHGADVRAVIRSTSFWLLVLTSFLIGMVDHAMTAHLVIYFDKDLHLGAEIAALGFSAMMLMSNVGKVAWGWLFDRFSSLGVAVCWFITALGVLMTLSIHNVPTLLLFALIYGPCQGGMLLMISVMSKHCFGNATLANSIAILSGVFNIGSAVGPAVAGYGYDATGSYQWPFTVMAASALICSILAFFINPTFRRTQAAERLNQTAAIPVHRQTT